MTPNDEMDLWRPPSDELRQRARADAREDRRLRFEAEAAVASPAGDRFSAVAYPSWASLSLNMWKAPVERRLRHHGWLRPCRRAERIIDGVRSPGSYEGDQ